MHSYNDNEYGFTVNSKTWRMPFFFIIISHGTNFGMDDPGFGPYKIIFLGDARVGKSTIVSTVTGRAPTSSTIGADIWNVNVDFLRKPVILTIWDTGGSEKFNCVMPLYMRDARLAVLCFSLSNPQTFENVQKWYADACEAEIPHIIFVANKSDKGAKLDFAVC
jgi:small GTP-binding protein